MENPIILSVNCPECGVSLIDEKNTVKGKPAIRLDAEISGRRGVIYLSAEYDSFDKKGSVPLPDGAVAKMYCPHCYKRLMSDLPCEECRAKMVHFSIEGGGDIHICSRVGCREHYVDFTNSGNPLQKLFGDEGHKKKNPLQN